MTSLSGRGDRKIWTKGRLGYTDHTRIIGGAPLSILGEKIADNTYQGYSQGMICAIYLKSRGRAMSPTPKDRPDRRHLCLDLPSQNCLPAPTQAGCWAVKWDLKNAFSRNPQSVAMGQLSGYSGRLVDCSQTWYCAKLCYITTHGNHFACKDVEQELHVHLIQTCLR